jgi:hypothetical protein
MEGIIEGVSTTNRYEVLAEWNDEEDAIFYSQIPTILLPLLDATPREVELADGTIHYYNSSGEEVKAHQRFAKTQCNYKDHFTIVDDLKDCDPPIKQQKIE